MGSGDVGFQMSMVTEPSVGSNVVMQNPPMIECTGQLVCVPNSGASTPRDGVHVSMLLPDVSLASDRGRLQPTGVWNPLTVPPINNFTPSVDSRGLPTIDIPGISWANGVINVEMGEENPEKRPLIRNRSPDGSPQSSEPPRKAPLDTQHAGGRFMRGPHRSRSEFILWMREGGWLWRGMTKLIPKIGTQMKNGTKIMLWGKLFNTHSKEVLRKK